MIGYVTLGTNDLKRAGEFYDQVLAELGAKRGLQTDRMIFWNAGRGPSIAVIIPHDQQRATHGNGTMVALHVESNDKVAAIHQKALSLGAKDEGAPGFRTETFYGAYFRDFDGNKLALFCMNKKA